VIQAVKDTALFMPTDLAPYIPPAPPKTVTMGGGGGGGNLNPLPQTKGKLPKIAPKQYVPPTAEPIQNQPKLVMEPTIVLQQDAPIPQVALTNIGDPFAMGKIPSNGPGSAGGIGSGKGGGVGRVPALAWVRDRAAAWVVASIGLVVVSRLLHCSRR
jgi:periplasmic protein TonB